MVKRILFLVMVGALVLAGCAGQGTAVAPTQRAVYMAAIEPKGSTTVDKEPFPAVALPEGGGYALDEPDANGAWVVETYRWDPGTIVVNQGDVVTLEIIGINGKEHPFTIEGYNISDVVKRGQVTRVTFAADKAGIFKIKCSAHQPSVQADLVVLPNK
ncbi:MAG: cupredoxin domain-containing protein [Chloroflexi bacterium]|nr:cupredoxin domain-containing protein [Chloroflexota bacterium]MBI3764347.1 cupredoxin domain-containing protein [Chloroflexota bacterium]